MVGTLPAIHPPLGKKKKKIPSQAQRTEGCVAGAKGGGGPRGRWNSPPVPPAPRRCGCVCAAGSGAGSTAEGWARPSPALGGWARGWAKCCACMGRGPRGASRFLSAIHIAPAFSSRMHAYPGNGVVSPYLNYL